MAERKKIAIILSRFPYPLDKGDKLRAYHQIKYLSKFHDIYLYTLCSQPVKQNELDELNLFCKDIHTFQLNKLDILIQTFLCFVRGIPVQVGYFFSPSINKKISASIIKLKPDTVYCQLSRTAFYGKDLPFKKVIDLQDAFSTNYERIQNNYSGLLKYFYKRESQCMKAFEMKMTTWFDETTIISEFDKDKIKVIPNRIAVVSNGVDTNYFKPDTRAKTSDILFCGNLAYLPNKNAVKFLLEKIAPNLISTNPHIRIAVIGSNGEDFKKYESDHIHIHGWINDIREAYASSKIFVAPLFTGAGLQNKLLEAMSMGLPCITTSITNASLMGVEDKHLLIANDVNEFVEKIRVLLDHENMQNEISTQARIFVEENFCWDKVNEKLLKLL